MASIQSSSSAGSRASSETLLSVGIDIGTSTTTLIFSRLTIVNLAGPFSVPRLDIVDKQVVYRGVIHRTPLTTPQLIDAEALARIVLAEYAAAGLAPGDVGTGAAIITGETARADNASQVLAALSQLAGEFVVATAGPHLESVLAARGAGLDRYSERSSDVIANLDVGGGTTNIALYREGRLLATTCLDIGGRLVRIDDDRIGHLSPAAQRLASASGIVLKVGDVADLHRLRALTRAMAQQAAMGVNLLAPDAIHEGLQTNNCAPLPSSLVPSVVNFSGGVADMIDSGRGGDPFRFGDVGVLLGWAIADEPAFRAAERFRGAETIGATVVGAGVHTTEISGSTIEYAVGRLPLQNIPIVHISEERARDPATLAVEILDGLLAVHPDRTAETVAIAMSGNHVTTFEDVQATAGAIIDGAGSVLDGPNTLVIVLEHDRAKVLGQSLMSLRGRRDNVICIDGVQTASGDYIDIGTPVGAGRAVPVVVKTLVFNH